MAEFGDVPIQLGDPSVDEFEHVLAGSRALVAEGDHPSYLPQTQPSSLGGVNEAQPIQHVLGIVSVAAGSAFGLVEQTEPLVVAQRLGRNTGVLGHLSDSH